MSDKEIKILAIESSCDETAAAVDGKRQGCQIQCDFIIRLHFTHYMAVSFRRLLRENILKKSIR